MTDTMRTNRSITPALGPWFLAIGYLLLVMPCVRAVDCITATIQITNAPSAADTLDVNSDTRTWYVAVTNPATEILIGATPEASTTNLWNHTVAAPFSGPIIPRWDATNQISLIGAVGEAMAVTASGTWATVTYSTQAVTLLYTVRVPITGEDASIRTNIATLLATNMTEFSQLPFAEYSTLMQNAVGLTSTQTISGPKTWSGANTFANINTTNLVNHGNAVSSPGVTGNLSEQFGTSAEATNDLSLAVGYSAFAGGAASMSVGNASRATDSASMAVGSGAEATAPNAVAVGTSSSAGGEESLALGNQASAAYDYSIAIGSLATATTTNQIILGNAGHSTLIEGDLHVAGTTTLAGFSGTAASVTNGTFTGPTLISGKQTGLPFESYDTDSTTLQLGLDALASGTETVAAGHISEATGNYSTAVGSTAVADMNYSTAIGYGSDTTVTNQIRLGTASETVSMPGPACVGGNASIGSDAATFPASLAGGLYLVNGTAASADPGGGAALWSASGVLQYRTSGSSEGAGGICYVHNRAAETVGSGTGYTLTTSYALVDFSGTDPDVTLPSAGTWLILATIQWQADAAGAGDHIYYRLYNVTDSTDVSNTEIHTTDTLNSCYQLAHITGLLTTTTAKRVRLEGKNATSARGVVMSTGTKLTYIRLY